VQDAWQAPARALRVNVLGTHHLFEAARELGSTAACSSPARRMIYRRSLERSTKTRRSAPARRTASASWRRK
jgi:hypothetical protein